MDPSSAGAARWRAEQCLSVAEKLLVARDLEGCKQFSSQALAADPNTPGAEEVHAAASVLLAAERGRLPNGQADPYAVLGLDSANPASRHPDAVHSHFRRLSFLLNRSRPDRPFSLAFANAARIVADAWGFLSDSALKSALDADLNAAAAARAYHSPAPNRPQSQSSLPARPNPPFVAPSPWPTPPPAAPTPRPMPPVAPSPRPTPPPAVPSPCPTLPQAAPAPRPTPPQAAPAPRPTPPPVVPPPQPQPPQAASPTWPTPAPVVSPPRATPPPAGPQTRPTPLAPAPQTPAATTLPPAASGTPPSTTFWTICTVCRHIHQYDRLYEARKLMCPSCRQSFVGEAMAEPPPIVPGTNMYYCTWGFFPYGFPGCPSFEKLVNSQPQGPDQLNAPWLMGNAGVKGNAGGTGVKGDAENGVPVSSAVEIPVEVPAVTPPSKPMRVKVGAKKRGRPKGSKNKKKL